jgi:hypothetical protein
MGTVAAAVVRTMAGVTTVFGVKLADGVVVATINAGVAIGIAIGMLTFSFGFWTGLSRVPPGFSPISSHSSLVRQATCPLGSI